VVFFFFFFLTHEETTGSKKMIAIVGGGVAGLYVGWQLGSKAMVLESRGKVGGRCRTRYTKDGKTVLYETGPWRFHESHNRLKRLMVRMGLDSVPSTSVAKKDYETPPDSHGDLSSWDAAAKSKGAPAARRADVASGYEGMLAATNVVNVYHAQRHAGGKYFAIRTGFSSLIDALKSAAEKRGCRVYTKSRVVDVRRVKSGYVLKCSNGQTYRAARVICCVPPHAAMQWSISQRWLLAQVHSVSTIPLCHVYAQYTHAPPPTKKTATSGILAQTIPGDYGNGWFQASYSAGQTAHFWNRVALQGKLVPTLEKELAALYGYSRKLSGAKAHHWPHAVHFWRPAFGIRKSVRDLVRRCVVPHPVALPGFFWCGEAFSSVQGWVEGALQTADMVLRRLRHTTQPWNPAHNCVPRPPKGWRKTCLVVDGRVIDVSNFRKVHPGSEQAIAKFVGKDASTVFRDIGHSEHAWAHLFSLQIGWTKHTGK